MDKPEPRQDAQDLDEPARELERLEAEVAFASKMKDAAPGGGEMVEFQQVRDRGLGVRSDGGLNAWSKSGERIVGTMPGGFAGQGQGVALRDAAGGKVLASRHYANRGSTYSPVYMYVPPCDTDVVVSPPIAGGVVDSGD